MSEIEFNYEDVTSVVVAGLGTGDVTINPATEGAGSVSGRLNGTAEHLERTAITESQGTLRIDFSNNQFGQNAEVDVVLTVPAGTDLELTSGSAEVVATAELAATKITTGSGGVDLASVSDVKIRTGSGDIVIGDIVGSSDPTYSPSNLSSGSGDISVGSTAVPLQAKTASGDVHVLQLSNALRANTASGDISVPQASGSVELRSASGDINVGVADELPAWLDLSSVSGEVSIDLDASGQPAEGEPYVAIKASTASGDISVYRA